MWKTFNWCLYHLSSTPRDLRVGGAQLELTPLASIRWPLGNDLYIYNSYKFVTVSLPRRLRNVHEAVSEVNFHLDPEARSGLKFLLVLLESPIYNNFQGGGDERWAVL